MNTPRILLFLVLTAVGIRAQAQDNATPAPAAEPAQTEMQKWIATTDAQWQAVFNREVTDVHAAELKKLAAQYAVSLEAALTKATAAGDLDGAVALRNEQKRFTETNVFPEQDLDGEAASVKQIRAATRVQLAKIEQENTARTKALHAKYDATLAQAQQQLTQAKRLDDALLVKAKREEIAAAWTSPTGSVASPKIPEPAVLPINRPPALLAATTDNDQKSIVGKWIFRPERRTPAERELKADGTVIKEGGGTGTWTIEGKVLKIRYPDGHTEFDLPVRAGKLIGKGLGGEKVIAEKQ